MSGTFTGTASGNTGVADGIEDAAGNDLASFTDKALTNNSTQVTATQTLVGVTISGGSIQ